MSDSPDSRHLRLAERLLGALDPASLPARERVPERVGRYRVLGRLGRGGMGVVFEGEDDRGGRVAIKLLSEGQDANPQQLERFVREAQAVSDVQHPNVIRLRDVGEFEGAPFFAFELHSGGSLRELLKREGPLPPRRVAVLGGQLAEGLAAAHDLGILHRDVKPENVLLSADGTPILCDFGLAKNLQPLLSKESLTQTGAVLGTPGYLAPEQVGQGELTGPAADVYGLGATLYDLLTGRPPIVGDGLAQIVVATCEQKPPDLRSLRPEIPPALAAIVMRCLRKDPAARWESAGELARALQRATEARTPVSGRWVVAGGLTGAALIAAFALTLREPQAPPGSPPPLRSQPELVEPSEPAATRSRAELVEPSESAATLSRAEFEELKKRAMQAWGAGEQERALDLMRRAARFVDRQTQYNLGVLLLLAEGEGKAAREREAVSWLLLAAEAGEAAAMNNLGTLYAKGRGVEEDAAVAAEWFRRGAEAGLPVAMQNLADNLANGSGVAQDHEAAARWYRRAAERGDGVSMHSLSLLYAKGQGVPRDERLATHWLRLAAEDGQTEAMNDLAAMLLRLQGRGGMGDAAAAVGWYERAARAGNLAAMNNLATLLWQGEVVERDREAARRWYRRAAEAGHEPAMISLAGSLLEAHESKSRPLEAKRWLERAAEAGDADAMQNLGVLWANGGFGRVDEVEAARWYRRAAEAGQLKAMNNLASVLSLGRGVDADPPAAVGWYRRAAEGGLPLAMYNLGTVLLRGDGVVADATEARDWLHKAAEAGNLYGMTQFGVLLLDGVGGARDESEGARWIRLAAERGHPEGMQRYGELLAVGRGVTQDVQQAETWSQRARDAGWRADNGEPPSEPGGE